MAVLEAALTTRDRRYREHAETIRWPLLAGKARGNVGGLEQDVLRLSHGGPGMHARLTYELAEPDRMDVEMEMSPDGIDWSVLFEATYERVKGTA